MNSFCRHSVVRLAAIRNGFWALGLIALHLLLSPGASAQPARLSVAYTGVGPTHLPVWIAKETGIFARNGLDVQIIGHKPPWRPCRSFPAKWGLSRRPLLQLS